MRFDRVLLVFALVATSCAKDETPESATVVVLSLSFERLAGSPSPVKVLVSARDDAGAPVEGRALRLRTSRGTATALSDVGEGAYEATIQPQGTGEYAVTVSTEDGEASASATALVLSEVGARWGQPQAVPGVVNTLGWEDGPNISADGEWLFLQYVPVSPSCLIEADAAACDQAVGAWQAPARPGLPGAARIEADGFVHNGCPSLGMDEATADAMGVEFPPNALYGFRRQTDGSFAEPFVIAFAGADGCVTPTGPNVVVDDDGTATLIFGFDDPLDSGANDTFFDLYTAELPLGAPFVLGTYAIDGGQTVLTDMQAEPIAGSKLPGNQNNPFAFAPRRFQRAPAAPW